MTLPYMNEQQLRDAMHADKQKRLYDKILNQEQGGWRALLRKLGLRGEAKEIAHRKAYVAYQR